MNSEQPNRVSVIDPVTPAIDRVKLILFRPFDLGKWFVIGFCAWLAYLGTGGGGGGGGGGRGGGPPYNLSHKQPEAQEQIKELVSSARFYISNNLYWIIPVTVAVVVIVILIGLLLAWLSSRGKFMFLHCVATNKAQVVYPWHKFRQPGNSLFLFRIVLGLIGLVVVVAPIIGIVVLVVMMTSGTAPAIFSILGIIILSLVLLAFSILLFLVSKFTFDFVVPIMFLRMTSCRASWRVFMDILSANKLRFTLYLLFQIVIKIVIGAMVAISFCLGLCLCCASCLVLILSILTLKYIGTVVLLPLSVFNRSYSLYYLQQYGPEFDVFRPEIDAIKPV